VVGKEFEVSTPLLENILNQAESLQGVANYQFGEGKAALQDAAAFLKSKRKIVLSGMGASYFACIPFQHLLAATGFEVTCIETAELLYFTPPAATENAAVLLISRSGESVEVTKVLRLLSEQKVAVLGIVNVAASTLARQASCCVNLHSCSDQIVAIQTYTATLAVFALLHAAMTGEFADAQKELETTVKMLEILIPRWVAGREQWRQLLNSTSPIYILARGPAMGTAFEGALLMHETAKTPAVAMSVPQFRHGPVEVVDSNFRAIVIRTQAATSELDGALAVDIAAMGGQVCSIHRVGDVPERFASIFEVIPFQIAAYTKAELLGLTPGEFRWATAITSSEAGFCLKS
jgi:glucosamine--fructose-6-phosphate aminotransferase (isomerizing)